MPPSAMPSSVPIACASAVASPSARAGEEPLEREMRRELRRVAEPAVPRVERARERRAREEESVARERLGLLPSRGVGRARDLLRDLPRRVLERRALVSPRLRDPEEKRLEPGPAVPVLGREVRPGEERPAVRQEERRERPAAAPGRELDGRHVDVVHVGALLAVHLDRDEVLVQEVRDGGVLERLPLHHVTPVAGGVADREEDGLRFPAGPRERLVAPRVPVDRVVGVLEKVRRRFAREAVRHGHSPPRADSHARRRVWASSSSGLSTPGSRSSA